MIRIFIVVLFTLLIASPARAATVNFSGSTGYDLGQLAVGQNGVVLGTPISVFNGVFGFESSDFPSHSQININYSLLSNLSVNEVGAYSLLSVHGSCIDCSIPKELHSIGNTGGFTGLGPLGMPNMTPIPLQGSPFLPGFFSGATFGLFTLQNQTDAPGDFVFGMVNLPPGETPLAVYSVEALPSSVPLPPALPMFGSALLAVVAFATFRRRRA